MSELCNKGDDGPLGSRTPESGSICDRVTQAAKEVLSTTGTDLTDAELATKKATDLVKLLLPVADKDTLTVVYADASPSATITKSAEIDLAAPVVTLITPTQKLYTLESLLTLSAEVVDDGSGVKQTNIGLFYMNDTSGLNLNEANTLRVAHYERLPGVQRAHQRHNRGGEALGNTGGGQRWQQASEAAQDQGYPGR